MKFILFDEEKNVFEYHLSPLEKSKTLFNMHQPNIDRLFKLVTEDGAVLNRQYELHKYFGRDENEVPFIHIVYIPPLKLDLCPGEELTSLGERDSPEYSSSESENNADADADAHEYEKSSNDSEEDDSDVEGGAEEDKTNENDNVEEITGFDTESYAASEQSFTDVEDNLRRNLLRKIKMVGDEVDDISWTLKQLFGSEWDRNLFNLLEEPDNHSDDGSSDESDDDLNEDLTNLNEEFYLLGLSHRQLKCINLALKKELSDDNDDDDSESDGKKTYGKVVSELARINERIRDIDIKMFNKQQDLKLATAITFLLFGAVFISGLFIGGYSAR